ncbi:MAG: RNA polymerase sigma factor [Planctomycetota bacterium]
MESSHVAPPVPGTSREAWDARATELMTRFRDRVLAREAGESEDEGQAEFEALYAYTHRDVLVWVYSLLRQGGGRLDAHELVQDTFVNVFRYPKSFRDDGPSSFRVWVRTIAGNVVRRARSKQASRATASLSDSPIEYADPAPGPETGVDHAERAAELDRAFRLLLRVYLAAWGDLVPRDRRALELVEVEGLDYRTAAGELAVRAPNMKMIVFRSRQRLVRRMAELFAELGASLDAPKGVANAV